MRHRLQHFFDRVHALVQRLTQLPYLVASAGFYVRRQILRRKPLQRFVHFLHARRHQLGQRASDGRAKGHNQQAYGHVDPGGLGTHARREFGFMHPEFDV